MSRAGKSSRASRVVVTVSRRPGRPRAPRSRRPAVWPPPPGMMKGGISAPRTELRPGRCSRDGPPRSGRTRARAVRVAGVPFGSRPRAARAGVAGPTGVTGPWRTLHRCCDEALLAHRPWAVSLGCFGSACARAAALLMSGQLAGLLDAGVPRGAMDSASVFSLDLWLEAAHLARVMRIATPLRVVLETPPCGLRGAARTQMRLGGGWL